jgi:transposase
VVARLLTIPGLDEIAAMPIVAGVGDFHRFPDADRLAAYAETTRASVGDYRDRHMKLPPARISAPRATAYS